MTATQARFRRISHREAFKRFSAGKCIVLCPSNRVPSSGPFKEHMTYPDGYNQRMADDRKWVENDTDFKRWDSLINNWKFYNASYETGYYPHFYIEEYVPVGWDSVD